MCCVLRIWSKMFSCENVHKKGEGVYLEPSRTSKMEFFAKIAKSP